MDSWGICVRNTDCWFTLRLLQLIITPVTSSISGVCKGECKRVQVKLLLLGLLLTLRLGLKSPLTEMLFVCEGENCVIYKLSSETEV